MAIISLSNQTLEKYNVSSNVCNGEICFNSRIFFSKHSGYIIALRAMNDFGVSSTSHRIANLSSGKTNYIKESCNSDLLQHYSKMLSNYLQYSLNDNYLFLRCASQRNCRI